MTVRKLVFTGSAVALGLGLAGVPAGAFANDSPDSPPPASSTQPTVTQSAGTFTVTVPGVGSLSFGVDPTSGALVALTVTPAPGSGFMAGSPRAVEEGVQVLFTGTSGSRLLAVKVDRDEDVTEVKAEVEAPHPAVQDEGAPGEDREDNDGLNPGMDNDDNDGLNPGMDNDDIDRLSTTIPPSTATSGDDHGDNGRDTPGGDGQQTATTTSAPTSNMGDNNSGTSANGSNGGPSGSSGSGHQGSGDNGSGDSGSGDGDGSGSGSGSGSRLQRVAVASTSQCGRRREGPAILPSAAAFRDPRRPLHSCDSRRLRELRWPLGSHQHFEDLGANSPGARRSSRNASAAEDRNQGNATCAQLLI